jgi:hypothetical protein
MRVRVSNLTGAALDYAVAVAEGATNLRENPHRFDKRLILTLAERLVFMEELRYSTDWAQGGPIIEREWICADRLMNGSWWACKRTNEGDAYLHQASGRTPLVAAMRCYVASKLGDKVEVPDCLFSKD